VAGSEAGYRGLFPPFDRRFFESDSTFTRVGQGPLGGKAEGLAFIQAEVIAALADECPAGIDITVPRMLIIAGDMFDAFMARNRLGPVVDADLSDDRIAHAFVRAELPAELVGDLHALADSVRTPLAVRSSSLLEDALAHPFAGVYATKMIPNHRHGTADRFAGLIEAVKFVYASTFFAGAKAYRRALGIEEGAEKMAVIIQEVVGDRHHDRFYPDVSGVARSYSYYPLPGSTPEDGMASLALGLGKTVVDGETSWIYTPGRPGAPAPMASARAYLDETQTSFWAVNMGVAVYDPVRETEYLVRASLADAEADGTLQHIASTYDASSDCIRPGLGPPGPRVIDFGLLLKYKTLALNDGICSMMAASRERMGCEVEIEFAAQLARPPDRSRTRVGFLQLRPMVHVGSQAMVDVGDLADDRVIVASEQSLGNGLVEHLRDIVFVKPDVFEPAHTRRVAEEVGMLNRALLERGDEYVLIGFGRWGTADTWLGIPVEWAQISAARVVVETAIASLRPEMSQGSHFFHNLIGAHTLYLSVPFSAQPAVNWKWLLDQDTIQEAEFVRHVRAKRPLSIRVDGRSGRGVIVHHE
jgi:hypothetical protein